jgi:hypothetical protein|tara:strand:- start:2325 stop:3323 length:999 start_codon:yes stop_codon:yes gene_type:complete
MSTFREIITDVLAYSGQSRGGVFEALVKNQVNFAYRRVLDSGKVPHEHREFSLTSVADISKYGLPLYVRKVLNIEDPTTPRFVYMDTARGFDKRNPGATESTTPSSAYPYGARGVQKYPNSDGVLKYYSDSTADAGSSFKLRFTGFNTSGVLVTEEKALSGTASVDTATSWDSTLGIERITKVPAAGSTFTGNVTVTDDDDNVISVIPVWWDSPDYQWIEFDPIPAAAITYTIRCEMRKPPLVNDTDWPEFDQDFHDLLIWGVTQDLLPTLGKVGVADRHRATFESRMAEFTGDKNSQPASLYVFGNVQNRAGVRNRPLAPYIAGVDIGLVS